MTLTGRSRIAGVMGWPIVHSRSPELHGYWLERYKIEGACVPLAVAPENFEAALGALPALGFAGASITLPHKEAALELVGDADDSARRAGAVNTVVVRSDGTLLGMNTDGFGFLENIRHGCATWEAGAGPAVVLGAGGAARAIVAALVAEGVAEIRLLNRTGEKARKLAAGMGPGGAAAIQVRPWRERGAALRGAALLVNATSLGMTGQPALEIDLEALPGGALVNDIVYAPLETGLLAAARARGNPVVDGIGMLLHQARPSFAAWFGVEPEVTEDLRRRVLASREPVVE